MFTTMKSNVQDSNLKHTKVKHSKTIWEDKGKRYIISQKHSITEYQKAVC